MIKHYETFEVKIDPQLFIERMRGAEVNGPNLEKDYVNGYPMKSGWGFCELDSWHGKEDYYEVRIYPDGTCIRKWKYESNEEWGTAEGTLKKPYDELVKMLENGDVISQYLDLDDGLPF